MSVRVRACCLCGYHDCVFFEEGNVIGFARFACREAHAFKSDVNIYLKGFGTGREVETTPQGGKGG